MNSHSSSLKKYLRLSRFENSLRNLRIRRKLTLGFGPLVAITLLVVILSFLAGQVASTSIQRTQQLRVPTVVASASAQENLLKMLSNMRAYLATGEPKYRYRYQETRHQFEADIAQLDQLFGDRASCSFNIRVISRWMMIMLLCPSVSSIFRAG